jgi:hypothetical protein
MFIRNTKEKYFLSRKISTFSSNTVYNISKHLSYTVLVFTYETTYLIYQTFGPLYATFGYICLYQYAWPGGFGGQAAEILAHHGSTAVLWLFNFNSVGAELF